MKNQEHQENESGIDSLVFDKIPGRINSFNFYNERFRVLGSTELMIGDVNNLRLYKVLREGDNPAKARYCVFHKVIRQSMATSKEAGRIWTDFYIVEDIAKTPGAAICSAAVYFMRNKD